MPPLSKLLRPILFCSLVCTLASCGDDEAQGMSHVSDAASDEAASDGKPEGSADSADPTDGGGPTIFYVSLQGDDSWTGLSAEHNAGTDGPFRTPARAIQALNDFKPALTALGASVQIRAGTYFLGSPLFVTEAASGTQSHPTVIRSYPGEHALLSGGVALSGWTQKAGAADPSLMQADVQIAPAELQSRVQTLRVLDLKSGASRWASQARWPKKANDVANPEWQNPGFWLYASAEASGGAFNAETNFLAIPLSASDFSTISAWNLSSAQIQYFPLSYVVYNLPVWQLDPANAMVDVLTGPWGATSGPVGMRLALSNIPEVISLPDEWSVDRAAAKVFYENAPSEAMDDKSLVLSNLSTLLVISGTEAASAHDIVVQGLSFADTASSAHDYFPTFTTDMAVEVSFAEDVTLQANLFEFLGGSALCIRNRSKRVLVQENVLMHIGQTGIELLSNTSTLPTDASRAPSEVSILGNYLHDVTHSVKGAAMMLYSASSSVIEGNLIHLSAGPGIQVLGIATSISEQNKLLLNDIQAVNYGIADGAGIYLTNNTTGSFGNQVVDNRVLDIRGADVANGTLVSPVGGVGIYIDNWESGDEIRGNIVSGTSFGGVYVHGGSSTQVASNLIANGGQFELVMAGISGYTMEGNLVTSNVVAVTGANFQASNCLWSTLLAPGTSLASVFASDANAYCVPDPGAVVASTTSPIVFSCDVAGGSKGSLSGWQALGEDTQSAVVGLSSELQTDSSGHVIGLAQGALAAQGLGPKPELVTGLRHHAESRMQDGKRKSCLTALLKSDMYEFSGAFMPAPEAVFQCFADE